MKKISRFLAWAFGLLALLASLAGGGGLLWLRASLPDLEGNHDIAGLGAPVEVLRDGDGLVTIRAGNELDAARALGYVHAQDRLWQMDFMRRTGAGRLSEVIGPETLALDRLLRGLGLYRAAAASLAQLSPEARALFEAYSEGVNALIAEPGGPWPPEFHLLRSAPEPWRPADSLVWGRLMALQLSSNWSDEIRRLRLAERLTPEQIDFLWPAYPDDGPVTLGALKPRQPEQGMHRQAAPSYAGLAAAAGDPADILPWTWAPKDASNLWVLSGKRTESGKPILANDPHLGLEAPGLWYLVRIETPGLTLAGATTPGMPLLLAGHNGQIAWGFSTTHGDTQDLFIERPSKGKPGYYDTPEGPRPFTTREETIAVRGQAPDRLTLRETRHGPVLSDLRPSYGEALPDGQLLALAWPALRADDRSAEALYRLNRARDWPGFLAAMKDFHSPLQNVGYADTGGTIGLLAAGRVPLRKSGDGRAPLPGWTGAGDWRGFIPFAELPRVKNPPDGRLVNANNRIVGTGYPYLITADWPDPHRARRIEQLLNREAPATVDGSRLVQQDIVSLGAARLLPLLLERVSAPSDDRTALALSLLRQWDLRMARERPEPLIFTAWMAALADALLADELGPSGGGFRRTEADLLADILTKGQSWCDDVATPGQEDCATQVAAALATALHGLEQRFGSHMGSWRWGQAHVARFPHPVLRHIPLLGDWLGFAVEAGGGFYTVNRGGARLGGPSETRFEDVHGPGFRAVYDLADLDNSRFMIATGQSGNPLSPLYGSLAKRWRDGDYLKLVGDGKAAKHRLTLNPR